MSELTGIILAILIVVIVIGFCGVRYENEWKDEEDLL